MADEFPTILDCDSIDTESVKAPTFDRAVLLHPTGVKSAGADGGELTLRRCGLARFAGAPAGDGAIPPHPAVVICSGADRSELPGRWDSLPGSISIQTIVGAPAGDGTVYPHPAGMQATRTDRNELPGILRCRCNGSRPCRGDRLGYVT